jgi:hypothetical protein
VITFSGGIVKIPFTEMSPDIQKKYGYDPATAVDLQKEACGAAACNAYVSRARYNAVPAI